MNDNKKAETPMNNKALQISSLSLANGLVDGAVVGLLASSVAIGAAVFVSVSIVSISALAMLQMAG